MPGTTGPSLHSAGSAARSCCASATRPASSMAQMRNTIRATRPPPSSTSPSSVTCSSITVARGWADAAFDGRDHARQHRLCRGIVEQPQTRDPCRVPTHPGRLRPGGIDRLGMRVERCVDVVPGSCIGAQGLAAATRHGPGCVDLVRRAAHDHDPSGQLVAHGRECRERSHDATRDLSVTAGMHRLEAARRRHRCDRVVAAPRCPRRDPVGHPATLPGTRSPCLRARTRRQGRGSRTSAARCTEQTCSSWASSGWLLTKRTVWSMSGRRAATAASNAWSIAVRSFTPQRSRAWPPCGLPLGCIDRP